MRTEASTALFCSSGRWWLAAVLAILSGAVIAEQPVEQENAEPSGPGADTEPVVRPEKADGRVTVPTRKPVATQEAIRADIPVSFPADI
jgi:hypothetical protein